MCGLGGVEVLSPPPAQLFQFVSYKHMLKVKIMVLFSPSGTYNLRETRKINF